jgi:PPM family protein phosphatase
LLCTDGLTDMLTKEEIEAILKQDTKLETIAKTLVEKAKGKGGVDNITVLLVKVQDGDEG